MLNSLRKECVCARKYSTAVDDVHVAKKKRSKFSLHDCCIRQIKLDFLLLWEGGGEGEGLELLQCHNCL